MIEVNGRRYQMPTRPTVVVCIDGFDPAYLTDHLAIGQWTESTARAAMPTFTNPNNASIVTGVAPSVHGIAGNHFFDRALDREMAMTARSHMRCDTILDALVDAGVRVAAVTAKRKLLDLIAPRASHAASPVCYAGEMAVARAIEDELDVHSPEASLRVLDVALEMLERHDVVYASTTDYVQHKHAPGSPEALAFMSEIDVRLCGLAENARVVVTGDHGMNAKHLANGAPRAVWLERELAGVATRPFRVLLPITDPHVVHHGALGSAATIYTDEPDLLRRKLERHPLVERVFLGAEAAAELELPLDRIGDLFVVAGKHVVLGRSPEHHDLSGVDRLRSHGGFHEQWVPMLTNDDVRMPKTGLRNFDAFSIALS